MDKWRADWFLARWSLIIPKKKQQFLAAHQERSRKIIEVSSRYFRALARLITDKQDQHADRCELWCGSISYMRNLEHDALRTSRRQRSVFRFLIKDVSQDTDI